MTSDDMYMPSFTQNCDHTQYAFFESGNVRVMSASEFSDEYEPIALAEIAEAPSPDAGRFALRFSSDDPHILYLCGPDTSDRYTCWTIDTASGKVAASLFLGDKNDASVFWRQIRTVKSPSPALCRMTQTDSHEIAIELIDPKTFEPVQSPGISLGNKYPASALDAPSATAIVALEVNAGDLASQNPQFGSLVLAGKDARMPDASAGSSANGDADGDGNTDTHALLTTVESCPIDAFNCADCYTIALSPDGAHLLATCADNQLRCISLPDGAQRWECPFSYGKTQFMEYSPDGSFLIARDETGTWMKVDASSGKLLASSLGSTRDIEATHWSSDGSRFYITTKASATTYASLEVLVLDQESFGFCSSIDAAKGLSYDEGYVIACDAWDAITVPLYTLDELIEGARETTAGHELTDRQRALYFTE